MTRLVIKVKQLNILPMSLSSLKRAGLSMAALSLSAVLVACASSNRAPVEDRTAGARPVATDSTTVAATPAVPAEPNKVLPGAENAGKPGYYTVKPGETLLRIGLETGQNWKDLVAWNNLPNPNVLEVGQVLRIIPPGTEPAPIGTRPVTSSKVETRPLDAKPVAPAAAPAVDATPTPSAPPREGDDNVNWLWPASGPVVAVFDDNKSKGLAIAGKLGDPVVAAADGRVVYAGSGLRGYGNLIILKHNNTYLTAYAHNQTLLVKEDQGVRRGQKIAEMGSTDAERVQLHFEIRKQGKPIDPAKLLPPR
jgi:lipoprotein NlpD